MQGSFTKQKLTFAQLLHKYTKAVPKDRPLKKEPSSPPHQGKRSSTRGESSKRRVIALQCSLLRRCVLPRHGRHRHRVFLVLHGGMKEFGCIVIRCYTHHLTTGRRITEGLCSARFHDQCTIDWDPTNQVRGGSLHRSDRSPLTGQTGLIRDRTKLILQDRFTCQGEERRGTTHY